ncbi:MAG: T9SS type A sorting domain-containing protein [Bacteroidia bacterium]
MACRVCEGQNLVPNGDFEQYVGCPTNSGQIDSALFWINPSVNFPGGSPDYYNACSAGMGTPNNYWGYQPTHSGNAYCGIVIWELGFMYREYVETSLVSTLQSNECYHFEMYINLGNNSWENNSDDIGVYFSDTLIDGFTNYLPLPYLPQIENVSGNFPDTVNWTLVSGNYVAHGGENYLIIGNFKNDSNTTIVGTGGFGIVYLLIDDVSLSLCTDIKEENQNSAIIIYPNPITDKLSIRINNKELSEIILYDITSRKLLQQKFTNSVTLNTEQLAKGIYLYEVRNKNGVIKKGKVVKE